MRRVAVSVFKKNLSVDFAGRTNTFRILLYFIIFIHLLRSTVQSNHAISSTSQNVSPVKGKNTAVKSPSQAAVASVYNGTKLRRVTLTFTTRIAVTSSETWTRRGLTSTRGYAKSAPYHVVMTSKRQRNTRTSLSPT